MLTVKFCIYADVIFEPMLNIIFFFCNLSIQHCWTSFFFFLTLSGIYLCWIFFLCAERHIFFNCLHYRAIGLMSVRQWSGRPGFNPRSSHTKDSKMILDFFFLSIQHYKVRIKGKVEQSREWSRTLPYTRVVAIEKGAFGSPSTMVANFTFTFTYIRWTSFFFYLSTNLRKTSFLFICLHINTERHFLYLRLKSFYLSIYLRWTSFLLFFWMSMLNVIVLSTLNVIFFYLSIRDAERQFLFFLFIYITTPNVFFCVYAVRYFFVNISITRIFPVCKCLDRKLLYSSS